MANPGNAPFTLNPKDFQSIEVSVVLKNLTSGSREIGPKGIHLLELSERGLVLSVEGHFCAVGQQIGLVIRAMAPGSSNISSLRATAKVVETEHTPDADSITLKLMQFLEEEWQSLKSIYSGRQNEILEFFQMIKGVE